jgi:hypothetical protein
MTSNLKILSPSAKFLSPHVSQSVPGLWDQGVDVFGALMLPATHLACVVVCCGTAQSGDETLILLGNFTQQQVSESRSRCG